MRVLSPVDWGVVSTRRLTIVVGECPDRNFTDCELDCVMWTKSDYFARELTRVLSRSRLQRMGLNIGVAQLEITDFWGPCVVGVVSRG